MILSFQTAKLDAYSARGIYSLERTVWGKWKVSFVACAREWPKSAPVELGEFSLLEEAIALADRHAGLFERQMQRAVGE